MIGRKHRRKRLGAAPQMLGADNIDTRDYHGQVGDIIRIDPYSIVKIAQVRVAIRAEKAGLIEHGQARLDPATKQWLYTATAQNPEKDDWSIAATAVRAGPA